MTWSNRKVLITGADGFIGSHLAETLAAQGAIVTALALYNSFDSNGWLDEIPFQIRQNIKIVRGDIRDSHQMAALCQGQETVFHLAALIAIPYSYEAPSSYVQTNIQGTVNILKAALDSGVHQVVHTSTSEVYGTAQFTPITEKHPLQGQSPYSASKTAADMMAESFAKSFSLPVVILRPFNTYGPRQSERAVIAAIIRQIEDKNCKEIKLGDLTPKRDFNFVSDTVAAFLAITELANSQKGSAFNAGSGQMVSIEELVELIQVTTGTNKPVIQDTKRIRPPNSEVFALMADASLLEKLTKWKPRTSLEKGLEETIEWWRARLPQIRKESDYII
jgi:NAD dependent epimerase/dehydratase